MLGVETDRRRLGKLSTSVFAKAIFLTSGSNRWARVETLYHAARQRHGEERAAFLDAACGDDAELRREVESLLAQAAPSDGFLGAPAMAVAAQLMSDPGSSMLTGRRIGAYQVQGLLGAGGMGEVYRARDTKLGRDVAIKILPRVFITDPERLARFEREARMLAALNHPHIGAIYGVEEAEGFQALVLELVEGETLADRLQTGPMPVAAALTIARQIADALDAAHEKGIIHRDLKPANIKITPDGVVKVLDFGLAKATGDGSTSDLTQSPTVTIGGTREGVILGTAAYMSPEQARGQALDKRTDIWAFGVVVYEMLTGRTAFPGQTVSDTIAAILEREPDWSRLPESTPANIHRLLQRCLQKDAKRRLRDIGDARLELETWDPVSAQPPARPISRDWYLGLAGAAVAGVLISIILWLSPRATPSSSPQPARFRIAPPLNEQLRISTYDRDLAITPDGTRVVYVGGLRPRQLMVRAIDRLDGVSLVALDDSRGVPFSPFISPDSRWVGFFDNLRDGTILKKVSVAGGTAIALGAIPGFARGGSWGPDGTIVFATDDRMTGLLSVPAAGGDTRVLTRPNAMQGEIDHLFPSVLPDGRSVLFTITASEVQRENDRVAVLDLKSGQWKTLIRGASHAEYLAPSAASGRTGYLVYAAAGSLRAVRFDLGRLEIVGDPVPVVDHVMMAVTSAADFAISKVGTLVYVPAAQTAQRSLVWVDRQGREDPIPAPRRAYAYPRLSPDGTRLAVDIRDQENDIWIWDLARNALTRMTFDRGVDDYPIWTPDGRRIIFESDRSGIPNLFWQTADGSGNIEQLTTMASPGRRSPTSISPDGRHVVLEEFTSKSMLRLFDIGLVTPGRRAVAIGAGQLRIDALVQTDIDARNGTLSTDGRWLAYQSNNTGQFGQFQVYVRPFPNVNAGRWQVSAGGGTRPVWARNGRELFFLDESGMLTSVTVQTSGASFGLGKPTKVLETPYFSDGYVGRTYDVSADGQRFLMVKSDTTADQAVATMVVVLNWSEELKRLMPTAP